MLLENYGTDHPQVIALHARIQVVGALVAERRRLQAEKERDSLQARNHAVKAEPITVPAPTPPTPAPPLIVVLMPPQDKPAPGPPAAESHGSATPAGTSAETRPERESQRSEGAFGAVQQRLPLAVLGAALLGLLFHVSILVYVVCRQAPQHDGTVRVELINGASLGATTLVGVPARQAERPAQSPAQVNRATSEPEPELASPDLPIYRQLVADNLRLRAGLAELESAAA